MSTLRRLLWACDAAVSIAATVIVVERGTASAAVSAPVHGAPPPAACAAPPFFGEEYADVERTLPPSRDDEVAPTF